MANKKDDVTATRKTNLDSMGFVDSLTGPEAAAAAAVEYPDDGEKDIRTQLAEMQAKLRALTQPGGMPGGMPGQIPGAFVVRQPMTQLEALRQEYGENEFIDKKQSGTSDGMPPLPNDDPEWAFHWVRCFVGEKVDSANMNLKSGSQLRYYPADPMDPRLAHLSPYQTDDELVRKALPTSTQHGVIRCGDLVLHKVRRKDQQKFRASLEYDVRARRLSMMEDHKRGFDVLAQSKGFKNADQFLQNQGNEIVLGKRMNDDGTPAD